MKNSHIMRNHATFALLILGVLFSRAGAADWPQWRGPHFNGSSDAKSLPEKLDSSTQLWKAELPGTGSGTPIVWGERIFLTGIDPGSKALLAMCVSRKDGKVLWSKKLGVGFQQNNRNDMASPSPVTDGKTVWFYYATGDLVAFDVDGNQKWARNIQKDYGEFYVQWIYASSPLLYDGKLYIQVLQRDVPPKGPATSDKPADSYLLAIDPETGKDLWRVVRPNQAVAESKESYATPVPYEHDGKAEILLAGGDCVTAHDPQTGKELWRCGGWNPEKIPHWRLVASASATDGLVFACPPKKGAVFAIKDGLEGDVTKSGVAWKNPQITSDVCVPLIYRGKMYLLDGDKKQLYRVEPKTGEVLNSVALGGRSVFRASPTGADGKIYCMNEAGDVSVISADKLEILSTAKLGGTANRATIAVADGSVFIRTGQTLYAFGGKP
jgi:outer membrane protein assembly factor BamB